MANLPDPTQPPVEDPRPDRLRPAPSLLLVATGDGKGKSTAAFGTAMRAVARGWRVAVVQFLKSDAWQVGEEDTGKRLGFDWWTLGEGFTWDSANLSRDEAVARTAWAHARAVIGAGEHRLVVLDEITYPMNWGWIDAEEVLACLRDRPSPVSVFATGRDAPAALVALADTATEMRNLHHAYDRGIAAKKGIDY
jgi:cob(I)alamin adenosyltransferase